MEIPPFSYTAEIVSLISEISFQLGRYPTQVNAQDSLHLRRINRIRTIHGSLAIEGNMLSEEQVTAIINGRTVIAPIREIQEVRNALNAYELFPQLDAFDINDLLYAHGTIMKELKPDAGKFRTCSVGVYSDRGCIHIAPPPLNVPPLMNNLFDWLAHAEDHLLIRASVFHYEFEIIHPFSDGNGRTGRLWQSLIMSKFNPIFADLPVENLVCAHQHEYYEAIAASTRQNESTPFITFMLRSILKTLKQHQGEAFISNGIAGRDTALDKHEKQILSLIAENPRISIKAMAEKLDLVYRQCERIVAKMRKRKLIHREGANKRGQWRAGPEEKQNS